MSPTSLFHKTDNLINFTDQQLDARLATHGAQLEIGPFTVNVALKFRNIRDEFIKIYRDYPFYDNPVVLDNTIRIFGRNLYRQYIKPQAFVDVGMNSDFIPLPASMGMVSLEMGLNWQVASACKQYLMFHAGVVAKDGVGLVMPAMSGSGKSTLAAGLSYRGWQLHSDEFGLLDMESGELVPYPRAVSLKNQSIAVMKDWVGQVSDNAGDYFTDEYHGTPKGTICYLRPPKASIEQMHKRTKPNVVILPIYDSSAKPAIRPITKTMAFFRMVMSSANYGDIGEDAFRAISDIINASDVCEIIYPSLDDAVSLVEEFVAKKASEIKAGGDHG
ncbi:MAG: HprK-related kinase A [Emcibacteraceae bacterium]